MRLLSQREIRNERRLPWLANEYRMFRSAVMDPAYPCYFGTVAERKGHLVYTYAESVSELESLPLVVTQFLELSRARPQKNRHALVLFVKPKRRLAPHRVFEEEFWAILQHLHDHDPSPWPIDVPRDPQHPKWEFCFAGEPMFVFGAAPSYQARRSRKLGEGLTVLFQPRRVFDDILGGTPRGTKARELIRQRLLAWDAVEPHPDFGSYGDPSTNEWKQYFVPDTNEPVTGDCPLHIRKEKS